MPRDYKNIKKQVKEAEKKPGKLFSNLLAFIAGLSIGLFLATYIYLDTKRPWRNSDIALLNDNNVNQETQSQRNNKEQVETTNDLTIPKFEFYDILRNRKLSISERIANEQEEINSTTDVTNIYLLQVGSYKEYQAADQVKAQLALIGITANIQRVVINGQDSRHRVRVGPFEDPEKLKQTRRRLEENNHEYMLLKLEVEDAQG